MYIKVRVYGKKAYTARRFAREPATMNNRPSFRVPTFLWLFFNLYRYIYKNEKKMQHRAFAKTSGVG